MRYQYPLRVLNEHIFVEIADALWLIDTGSPSSFGGTIQFGATTHTLPQTMMGGLLGGLLSAEYLTKETGIQCSGLLGNDIMGGYNLRFDFLNGTLELHDIDEGFFSDQHCQFTTVMGVPLIRCQVNGVPARLLVDTGATISYWQHANLKQCTSVGSKQDFYPMFGSFTTVIYAVTIDCCHWSQTLKVGSLPGLLGAAITLVADGILGNESMIDRVFLYGFALSRCEWQ